MLTVAPASGVACGKLRTRPRTRDTCAGLIAGPVTMLAMFVATVPFSVGTHVFVPVVNPPSGLQLVVKHALVAYGCPSHEPDPLHAPPHAPTLHAVPEAAGGLVQPPLPASPTTHVPATWHESDATQVTGVPPPQVPPAQVCPVVHAPPVEQAVPFGAAGFEH
jgi:hypothetical protein